MRFGTSQSTPSFFSRDTLVKSVSLVGLAGLVFATLFAINLQPAGKHAARSHHLEYAEALLHEVNREPVADTTATSEAEGIELTGFETEEPVQTELAANDRGLFKSRSQERVGDSGMFSRRGRPTATREQLPQADDSFEEDLPATRDRTADRLPIGARKGTSTPSFDDEIDPNSTDRERMNGASPDNAPRGKPLMFDGKPSIDDKTPADAFGNSTEPFRANDFDQGSGTVTTPSDGGMDDGTTSGDGNFRRRPVRPNRFDDDGLTDDAPAGDPLDRGRTRDRWMQAPTNVDPYRNDKLPVRFDKRFLDVVRDNDVVIRRDEAEVYYWLLDRVRRVSPASLEQAGLREIQYSNLKSDPDRYRGEPITIEGDLWRLDEYDAAPNEQNIGLVYIGWVFTSDSGNHPYRVVATSLGRGIQPGVRLRQPVRITGYFFKREGYRTASGVAIAPTLLARQIGFNPMPNGIPFMTGMLPHVLGAIMAVGLALMVTVVAFAIGDERSMRQTLHQVRRHPQLSFAGVGVPAAPSVEESLRELAERERLESISGAYGPLLTRQTAREHAVHDYQTSRQILVDDGLLKHQRQTRALKDWATRQKENQAEIDAMRSGHLGRPIDGQAIDDELNSDKLDPALHSLSHGKPSSGVSAQGHVASPLELAAAAQVESDRQERERKVRDEIRRQQAERNQLQQVAHDLTEQERLQQERQRHGHDKRGSQQHARTHASHQSENHGVDSSMTPAEKRELDRLERERLDYEHRERERLEFERLEHERRERDRLEQERRDHDRRERERLELERLERERHERERLERERAARERELSHREIERPAESIEDYSPEFSDDTPLDESSSNASDHEQHKSGKHGGGWGWPQRRKQHSSTEESSELDAEGSSEEKQGRQGKRKGGWGWPKRKKPSESTDDASDLDDV